MVKGNYLTELVLLGLVLISNREALAQACGARPDPANGQITILQGDGAADGSVIKFECDTGHTVSGTNIINCAGGAWSGPDPTCQIDDCGVLGDPPGGTADSSGGTEYQSEATFTCNTGYTMTGTATSTCQAGSNWDNLDPLCEINDCGDVEAVDNGSPTYTSGTTYGSTATFTCDTGYTLSALTMRTCQEDKTWSNTNPTCDINDCGAITDPIPDGSINYSTGTTTYLSEATFSCDTGYTLSDNTITRECQADGSWTLSNPTCVINQCGDVEAFADGTVTYAGGLKSYLSQATFSCNVGYTLSGSVTRVCEADSTWSLANPTCIINDCNDPPTPLGGSVDFPDGTTYLSEATYSCDLGYTMNGSPASTCQADKTWSNVDPVCTINDCGPITDPIPDGSIDHTAGTTYLSTATFSCDIGYTLSDNTIRECQANLSWTLTNPTCDINQCGDVEAFADGTVTYAGGLKSYLSQATFSCNVGYTLSGSVTRVCEADSTWSLANPTCIINDCNDLPTPTGGSVDFSGGTTYLSVATFSCDTGYTMNGSPSSTCQADSTWSNVDPVCRINDCGGLGNPNNGNVDTASGTKYQDTATYSCETGYDLIGATTRTCQADSSWSGTPPTCDIKDCGNLVDPLNGAISFSNGATTYLEVATYQCNAGYELNGVATRTCEASGSWGGVPPTCDIKNCGTLVNPANGAVDTASGTTYGETATYTCDAGYGIQGDLSRTCGADGLWTGNNPICEIGDCGTLTSPTNGAVAVGQTTFGAKANYTCNSGYDIDGVESRTCQADSFWSDTAPICQLKDCGSPPYLQNGESSVSATTYGAEAIYSCSDGYGLVGTAAVQCLETGSWDTLPVCSTECGPPVAIENGQSSGLTGLLVGDTVTYSCDAGYELTLSEPTITCQIFGTWETAPGCRIIPIIYGETCSITEQCSTLRATCRSDGLGATRCLCATTGEIYDSAVDTCLADCGVLSNPTNGMVTNPDVTTESQTAEYSCNVGFAVNDINLQRRTCLATGEWSGDAPLCVVGCPEAVPPKNGNVDATQGTATGDTVFYSCNDGYRLVGASSSVCLQDTTWSENDPVCLIECPVLPAVEFSHVDLSSGNWENSVATYICKKDYALVGVATRTCQSTGLWNGKEPDCIFATFPDVLLVVGSLLLFLVIVDIFAIIFCVYIRYFKKDGNPRPQDSEFDYIPDSTDDDKEKYERFDRYPDYDEKPLDKMENGIPPATMIHAGQGRASFKKSRNAKVAPEDANKKNAQNALNAQNAQNAPRKPPVPRFDKANSKGIPKPKPLPKGTYKNTTGYGPKVYGPEPIRFRNETIPFVALETSHPPPSTQQPPVLDDFREEKVADVERLLRDEGFTSGSNGRGKSTADEDQISIDHLTNPVFPESHERPILMDYDAHTGQKPNDSDDIFKGRLTVPPVPKGQEKSPQEITEGERFLSDEARKHLKVSMTAYSPVLGKDRPPKV